MSKEVSKARVAFVVPFVGRWPDYAVLFFESCRRNPGADVLLVAPEPPACELPPNVRFIRTSAEELVVRLEGAMGIRLGSFRWHKLCDFRPFFGLAFADLLKPYEFWGYCDTDMMFGDISCVTNPEYLAGIDAFSAHGKQFVGHFTLLRNREDINRLGLEIPGWRDLCLTEKAEHLDEERLHDVFRSHPELRVDLPEILDRELEKPFCRHAITYTFYGKVADLTEEAYEVVTRWQDGKIFAQHPGGREAEALYIHFMALKHAWHWPRRKTAAQRGPHYFSRIGYGRIGRPEDLSRWRNRGLYAAQTLLLRAKKTGGWLARSVLPQETLRRVRRALKV